MPPSFIPNAPAGFSSFVGSGASLGAAQATITINTAPLQTAVGASQQAGKQIAAAFNQVNTGVKSAEKSFASLSDTLKQIGGAVGVAFGARAVIQFALAADTTATAYKRQTVAALSLAGSQQKLNELLSTYDRVTGGVMDKATAMADVTRLQAVGFADSASELERFTTAVRGMSVAMGKDQDYISSQLILEMTNQRGARLDQIGLTKGEVAARTKELQDADSSLTKEMAYQNAVLDIAIGKFGALVKSEAAQATGQEKMKKAWKDFSLELGTALGPATSSALQGAADQITGVSKLIVGAVEDAKALKKALDDVNAARQGGSTSGDFGLGGAAGKQLGRFLNFDLLQGAKEPFSMQSQMRNTENFRDNLLERRAQMVDIGATKEELANLDAEIKRVNNDLMGFSNALHAVPLHGFGAGGAPGAASKPFVDPNLEKQQADIIEWSQNVQKIESSANADRLSATTQYESQRSETIRSYEQGIAREAEDFAISRRRAAENLADTIAQIGVDSARQAAKWATDLADSIANMQADSGKRVAEAQEATGKRLAEINAEYAKNRERAARDHNDTLLEAAANLDARAVFNEQKNYARSSADAKDAHDKAISDTNDRLKEQTDKEAENLAERIDQAQKANAKQLKDAREADVLRIQQAKDALAKQQTQEDEDRALRLQRGAEDQAAQLSQMAQAQAERLAQIDAHAKEERAALDEEFLKQLEKDGLHNTAWLKQQEEAKDAAIKSFDLWWKHVTEVFDQAAANKYLAGAFPGLGKVEQKALGGPIYQTKPYLMHAGEWVMPKSMVDRMGGFSGARQIAMTGGRGTSIGNISFTIYGAQGQSEEAIGRIARAQLLSVLEN